MDEQRKPGSPDIGNAAEETRRQVQATANEAIEQAKTVARNVGEQAKSVAADAGTRAQDLARRAREQAMVASDTLYEQGTRAGEYIARGVDEYPFTALLVAGAIGYGLAYLIHSRWS